MSNETLTVKLTVLEDGKIEAITNTNEVVYLQPIIVVDAKETTARVEVKGEDGNQVRVSEDVTEIDGVAFSGNFEALETALREAALKANGLLNGGVSGGGGSSDTTAANQVLNIAKLEEIRAQQSTAAKQDAQTALITELDDNTKRKAIGSVVDLTADINGDWVGFPLAADTLSLTINGDTFDFSIPQVSANNKVLVEQFNNAQNLVSFDYVKNEDKIVFNGVNISNVEVQLIAINVVGLAQLGYNTFTESTEQETGALQQLVLLLQAQLQVSKGAEPKPTPDRLVNPSTVDFTGFKYLVFSCDGANNSITVTQNGSSVTYPQPNLDGSLLRGYELPLSKVPYTNSITFNGTGTVDILKID